MGEFVPLYRQVSQRIFRKIQQGVYKYGDKIPSEKELAAYYGVNRMRFAGQFPCCILFQSGGKGTAADLYHHIHCADFLRHGFTIRCLRFRFHTGSRLLGRFGDDNIWLGFRCFRLRRRYGFQRCFYSNGRAAFRFAPSLFTVTAARKQH